MLRVSQLAFLMLLCATAGAAPCPEAERGTLTEWKSYGEVEYASRAEGEPDFGARFVLFANRERLHEKRAPESMPVSGWQYDCPAAGADVRGNHRLVPAGVTLGDVRRGWRGACD